jgi:hypothetical protein
MGQAKKTHRCASGAQQLSVTALDGAALGRLTLLDPNGRLISQLHSNGNSAHLDLSGLSHGVYALWLRDRTMMKRVVVGGR